MIYEHKMNEGNHKKYICSHPTVNSPLIPVKMGKKEKKEMVEGIRPAYDTETRRQIQEHSKEDFREAVFEKVRKEVPDLTAKEAGIRGRTVGKIRK